MWQTGPRFQYLKTGQATWKRGHCHENWVSALHSPLHTMFLIEKKTRRRRIENSEIHQANGVRSHVTSIHLNQWMNMWPLSFSSSISARSWQRAGNAGRVNDADYLSSRLPFGRVRLMNTCTRYICPYSGNNLIYYSRSWPPSARGETKLNTKIEWLRERSVSACFTIQLS